MLQSLLYMPNGMYGGGVPRKLHVGMEEGPPLGTDRQTRQIALRRSVKETG